MQLRQDNLAGITTAWSVFRRSSWGEQARVLRLIRTRGRVRAVRDGSPQHLREWTDRAHRTWQVRGRPTVFFAGQMSGAEGYVERRRPASGRTQRGSSARRSDVGSATDHRHRRAVATSRTPIRRTTSRRTSFGIMQPLDRALPHKLARKLAPSERALADLARWMDGRALADAEQRSRAGQAPAALASASGVGSALNNVLARSGAPRAIRKS